MPPQPKKGKVYDETTMGPVTLLSDEPEIQGKVYDEKTMGPVQILDDPTDNVMETSSGVVPQEGKKNLDIATDTYKKTLGVFRIPEVEEANSTWKAVPSTMDVVQGRIPKQMPQAIAPPDEYQIESARNAIRNEIDRSYNVLQDFVTKHKEQLAGVPVPLYSDSKQPSTPIASYGEMLQKSLPNMGTTIGNAMDLNERIRNSKGDTHVITPIVEGGLAILEREKQDKRAQLENEYPLVPNPNFKMDNLVRENASVYNQKLAELDSYYNSERQTLINAASSIAATKVVNEAVSAGKPLSPQEIGIKVRESLADKTTEKIRRLQKKGLPISPEQKVADEVAGYQAMKYAEMDAFANGNMELASKLNEETKDYSKKIIDNNPEFKKGQLVKVISEQIAKTRPKWNAVTGYDITPGMIQEAARQLNIPEEDVAALSEEDFSGQKDVARRFLGSFVENTAGGIYETALMGLSRLSGSDQDVAESAMPENWYNLSWFGKNLKGGETEQDKLFAGESTVSTSPDNYLMNVHNPNSGSFQPSIRNVLGVVVEGAGQMAAMAAGGSLAGRLTGLGDKMGLMLNTFATGYEDNYRSAKEAIGDAPEDEAKRNAYAFAKTAISGATELVLPDMKLADDILESGTANYTRFVNLIDEKGVDALQSPEFRDIIKSSIKDAAIKNQTEVSEDILDEIGGMVVDATLAPNTFKDTDYGEKLKQTYITSTISSLLPTAGSAVATQRDKSPLYKSMLFEVGANPQLYVDEINSQLTSGELTQPEANSKIQTINTLASIYNKSLPQESLVNNEKLDDKQKADYMDLQYQYAILDEKKKNVQDPVQEQIIDNKIKELESQKAKILGVSLDEKGNIISSPQITGQNENLQQTNEAEKAEGQQEAEGLLTAIPPQQQQTEGVASTTLTTPVAVTTEQIVGAQEAPGFFEEEETTISEPQNIEQNATTISEGQEQISPTESSISQYTGTKSRQPKSREGTGGERQTPQPEANSSNRTERSTGFEIQRPQRIEEYTTLSGNQKVLYQNGGLRVINVKNNEEVSAPTRRKAIQEAAQKYDFTRGERAIVPEDATGMTDEDISLQVAETSNSPIELIELYQRQEPDVTPLSSKETAIVDFGGFTTTKESYNRFGDRNKMDRAKAINYTKSGAAGIDQIAQEISSHSGLDITPEDLVEFIDRFPGGIQEATRTYENKVAQTASDRFREMTGFDLTPNIIKTALEQEAQALSDAEKDFLNKEYESREQLEADLEEAYRNGQIELQPEDGDNTQLEKEEEARTAAIASVGNGPITIQQIAGAVHEGNRKWNELHGDYSQVPWSEAPDWQKDVAVKNVQFILDNPNMTGRELNKIWFDQKVADGWRYGPVKDADKKTHPALLPYDELSEFEKIKDILFIDTVNELKGRLSTEGNAGIGTQGQPDREKLRPISDIDEQLAKVINEINDLNKKVPKAEEALTALRKQGKTTTDEYKIKLKAWQQLKKKQTLAEQKHKLLSAKVMAAEIRKRKLPKPPPGEFTDVRSGFFGITDRDIVNAAYEVAAKAIEAKATLQDAIQKAVDYINDRVFTKWDEPKFRESMGEGMAFPLDAEEIRALKVKRQPLSQKNTEAANILVEKIRNNEFTIEQAEAFVNAQPGLSNAVKERINQYIRKQATDTVFKQSGQQQAAQILEDNDNDYDAALQALSDQEITDMLTANSDTQRENIRATYSAARANIATQKVESQVASGDIKPVSIFAEKPTPGEQDPMFEMPAQKYWQKKRQEFADRFQRLQQGQANALKDITEETDAVSGYRLSKGKAWANINEIRDYLGDTKVKKGSFFDRLHKAKIDINKFGLYLYAKHAPERNAKNAEQRRRLFEAKVYELNNAIATKKSADAIYRAQQELQDILAQKNPDYVLMPDGGSGMTDQQAKDILDEVEKDGMTDKYEEFAQEFKENVVDKILDFKYERGLMDEEEYESIRNAYENYVPLKIDLDAELNPEEAEKSPVDFSRKSGRDLYRSRGAAEMDYTTRFNPVLQAIQDLEYSMLKGEENMANIRMANLIRENPNPEIWEIKPSRYEYVEGKDGEVATPNEQYIPNDGIPFWENGKKSYIVIKDEGMRNTFKKIKPTQALRMLQGITNWVRTFATLTNPAFVATNAIIDMQDAAAYLHGEDSKEVVKEYRKNLKNYPKILKQIFTGKGEWADIAKEWEKQGGKVTFNKQVGLNDQSVATLKTFEKYDGKLRPGDWRKIRDAWEHISETLEVATRVVVYKSAKDAGLSDEKSALLSRDATIDFEKSGTQGVYLNAFKAFLNAGIQGTLGTANLLKRSKAARLFAGGIIAAGMAQAFANDMFSDCEKNPEDCYWEVPEWRKQRGIMIPTGSGAPVSIPIGRRLGWFNYMGQSLYALAKYYKTDGQYGSSPVEFAKNIVTSFTDYYNPTGGTAPISQQMAGNFAPLMQLWTNTDAFGMPIVPQKEGLPMSQVAYDKTPQPYKTAAEGLSQITGGGPGKEGAIEISPEQLQHVMDATFTGFGSFIGGVVNTAKKSVSEEEKIQARDVPVVSRFVRESNMSVTKERKSELVEKADKNLLTEGEMDKLEGYLESLTEGGQITEEQADKTMKYVNRRQKDIERKIQKAEDEAEE